MAEDRPQIYLLTPPSFDLDAFPQALNRVLGSHEIACIRLALATRDEDAVIRAADAVQQVAYAHDVALVIEDHVAMVERLGLDGVHLSDGARSVRAVRKTLGSEAIVGASCGATRHEGMNAGEAGADYVSFGPVGDTGLGHTPRAERDLFAWWSEMIEVPVVAEGALTPELIRDLSPVTDFFAIGEEIWRDEDPAAALSRLTAAMTA